jgi:hypothetical protein
MAKIDEFINKAERLLDSGADSPEFKRWRNEVENYLKKLFGNESNELALFENIEFYNYYLTYDLLTGGWRKQILKEKDLFKKGIKNAIFHLKNFEEEIIEKEERAHYLDEFEDEEEIEAEAAEMAERAGRFDGIIDKGAKRRAGGAVSGGKAGKSGRNKNIFIVQGKNDGVKKQVANFLLKTVIKPIVLNVDERGIKMSSDTKDVYFEIDQEGKWQLDIAKKLKAMKLELKQKNLRE